MNALRRPEVLVLAAIVLAGLAWVTWNRRPDTDQRAPAVSELMVTRATATPDGSHTRLRIDFSLRHSLPDPINPHPPAVRLLDQAGATVPEFFLPGEFPPALPPGATVASWAEFWADSSRIAGPLTLEVAGARAPVTVPR